MNLKDVFSERITTQNVEEVNSAIMASVDEHNRQLEAVMSLFVSPTTFHQKRYKQTSGARLQPLDADGRALPVKPSGYYDVAFPIHDAGTAWGANFKTLAKMTVADAARITGQMLTADKVWMRDQMLSALFASATYTHTDPEFGALTIQPLANGDAVTYARNSSVTAAIDTHQLATASAIADATDPFPTIFDELSEHPENPGDVVVLIPSNLKATTIALAGFSSAVDPNLRDGADTRVLTGNLGVSLPGPLLGYHDAKVWIAEWKALPDNYAIATTTGAESALGMRQEPEPELQGFFQAAERNNHPFYERQWVRYAGFGANNRVGALVYRFGNGTYAVPTGYTPPIP
jgi:hypothetical protein